METNFSVLDIHIQVNGIPVTTVMNKERFSLTIRFSQNVSIVLIEIKDKNGKLRQIETSKDQQTSKLISHISTRLFGQWTIYVKILCKQGKQYIIRYPFEVTPLNQKPRKPKINNKQVQTVNVKKELSKHAKSPSLQPPSSIPLPSLPVPSTKLLVSSTAPPVPTPIPGRIIYERDDVYPPAESIAPGDRKITIF